MKKFGSVNKIKFLPIVTVIWLLLTFIVSYTIATTLNHVYPVWPYISDTGTTPPESCWFGLMLNIGSLLMGLVFYCQYIQVKLKLTINTSKYIRWLNNFCLLAGIIAALGACIVANFQETSDIKMHLLGANMIFGVGAGYFILQTLMCSFLNGGDRTGFILNIFRGFLCVIHVTTFATTLIYARISLANLKGKSPMHFSPDMENYEYRLASTFSEWILAVCLGLYLLTFYHDFKHLKLNSEFYDVRKRENVDRHNYQIA